MHVTNIDVYAKQVDKPVWHGQWLQVSITKSLIMSTTLGGPQSLAEIKGQSGFS
jgi:hypothetical protein